MSGGRATATMFLRLSLPVSSPLRSLPRRFTRRPKKFFVQTGTTAVVPVNTFSRSGVRVLGMPMEKESCSAAEPRYFAFLGGLETRWFAAQSQFSQFLFDDRRETA